MNKNYLVKTVLCALVMIISACSSDDFIEDLQSADKLITMSATDFKFDSQSRTSFEVSSENAKFTWAANDTVGIFPNEGTQAAFPMSNGAGTKSASFNGGGWALKPSSTYAAYYPYDIQNNDVSKISVTYEGQTQKGNASTAHIGKYDYMAAIASTPDKGSVNFDFKHLGCLMELKLNVESGKDLRSITLESDEAVFTTEGYIDLTQNNASVISSQKSKSLNINIKNLEIASSKPNATIYFMMAPADLSGKQIKVNLNYLGAAKCTYDVVAQNYESGKAYHMVCQQPKEETTAELRWGYLVNALLDELCPRASIQEIKFECSSKLAPPTENFKEVSSLYSEYPIYAVCNNRVITVYTSANKIKLNRDSDGLFAGMRLIRNLDLSSFDTSNVTNMGDMFSVCSSLTTLDLSSFDTSSVTNMSSMFAACSSLTTLDLSHFTTTNVTDMTEMFSACSSLTTLDLSSFNTMNVTSMRSMFLKCSHLSSLDLSNFNTMNVTSMWSMFAECSHLIKLDLSNFDTTNVSDMGYMFSACNSLSSLNLSNFQTTNVTSMNSMFSSCLNLTTLDLSSFDTSNVTDMGFMFSDCSSLYALDLSNFDTMHVTGMSNMFARCSNLTTLDVRNFNTSNVTDMGSMFSGCSHLTALDVRNFNTSNVTDMGSMFSGCSHLTALDLSIFNTANVSNMGFMFSTCLNLTRLDLKNFDTRNVTNMFGMFSDCSNLTVLDLSSFDTSNVSSMWWMFSNCSKLTTLDLGRSFMISNAAIDSMCSELKCDTLKCTQPTKNHLESPQTKLQKDAVAHWVIYQ